MERPRIAVLTGPTASGKSGIALEAALELGAEIISADSMQVYRGLDIGTAKPSQEERRMVPHHLIDVAEITESYSAGRFRKEAGEAIESIHSRGKPVIVVGGTLLYIKALLEGLLGAPVRDEGLRSELGRIWDEGRGGELYEELKRDDPLLAARLHPNDRSRIIRGVEVFRLSGEPLSKLQEAHGFSGGGYDALVFAVEVERPVLYRAIDERVGRMLREGWIEEVRGVLDRGYSPSLMPLQAIGYREIVRFLTEGGDAARVAEEIKQATRNFAKRQETWLKKMAANRITRRETAVFAAAVKNFLQSG
ncbi:tRNA (adenosine(37)-N6)-dimethylallyltransferase MiaA [bacterium]|nr:MAG: tRNA (adenosine(37)-N6)-dimethylallyltransferase MiaA [bacterium]